MSGQIIHAGSMRVTRLDEDGNPTGEPTLSVGFLSAKITSDEDRVVECVEPIPAFERVSLTMIPITFRMRGRQARNWLRFFWTPTQLARLRRRAAQKTHRVRGRRRR